MSTEIKFVRSMQFIDNFLDNGEYIKSVKPKKTIILHHTAGGDRPDWTIHGWNTDKTPAGNIRRVGTAFVIGGKAIRKGSPDFEGKIYRAFDEKYWAYHIGGTSDRIESQAIAIELCNYGWAVKSNNGKFYNYVNGQMPEEDIIKLDSTYRGFDYFHKYTNKQLDVTRELLIYLSEKYEIDLKKGILEGLDKTVCINPKILNNTKKLQIWLNENGFTDYENKVLIADGVMGNRTLAAKDKATKSMFEIQTAAKLGQPGLWSHVNFVKGKWDMNPQPELISMLRSL